MVNWGKKLLRLLVNIFVIQFLDECYGLKIINSPTEKYVRAYENAVFECHIDEYRPEVDIVEWCKNDFCTWGRSIETNDGRLRFKSLSKYYIIGDRRKGQWNLLIENVTDSDLGKYKCTVTRRADDYVFKTESESANLTIMEQPTGINVERSQPNEVDFVLHRQDDILCTVENGKPAPKIYWILIDNEMDTQQRLIERRDPQHLSVFKLNETSMNDNRDRNLIYRMNVSSSQTIFSNFLRLNATMFLLNKTLACVAEHPMLDVPLVKSIKINLKYPPILTVSHEPNEALLENRTYIFNCESKSNQNSMQNLKFYMIGDTPTHASGNLVRLNGSSMQIKLEKSMNGNTLVCEDENEIGKSKFNFSLNVLYAPKFVHKPDKIIVLNESADSVSLLCNVDSNPKSVIFWLKNDKEVVQIGEKLNLRKKGETVNHLNAEYTCQARSTVFKTISTRTSVITQGLPTIIGESIFYSACEHDVDIDITVLSNPAYQFGPICTRVKENNSQALEIILPIRNHLKYDLERHDLDELKVSTKYRLRIKHMTDDDFGNYNCTVTNKYGTRIYAFEIKKKTEENYFWFILMVTVLILLTILSIMFIIFAFVFIHKRRENNKKKILPNVSDYSGKMPLNLCVIQADRNLNEIVLDKAMLEQQQLQQQSKMNGNKMSKSLSDDFTIDNSFKKQSNQISLIVDPNLDTTNNFSFESLTFTSDTQNLILIDNIKSLYTHKVYSSPGICNPYKAADVFVSKLQTNV